MSAEIECPYCEHEFTDSWEYADTDRKQLVECEECSKIFELYVEYSVSYISYPKGGEDE